MHERLRLRVEGLREGMEERGVDGLVVSSGVNRRYLSGFTGSAGLALITPEATELVVDGRYTAQAQAQAEGWRVVEGGQNVLAALEERVQGLGSERLGFEADHVSVSQHRRWSDEIDEVEWVPTSGWIEGLRVVKDAQELEAIRRAADIADRVMEHAYDIVRPGITEKELAWRLEVWMREHGAEGLSFDTIVASGEHSALPHHRPSDREIQSGEPITIDLGAVVDGYCSDLTRSFSLGPVPNPEYSRVWGTVHAALQRCLDSIRPGMTGPAADAVARDLIEGAGYGDDFRHGLGHGVGAEIHEGPRLSRRAPDDLALASGMVVTIEPGIYLPDRFGVRIEDLVVLTDDGVESLSAAPKRMVLPAG